MEAETGIREIAAIAWRGRWWIASITSAFVLVTGGIALQLPRQYTATVVVVPASNQNSGALGGVAALASQFGGLASLAGIRSGTEVASAEAVAVLQSGVLTMNYVRERNLLPILFSDSWDQGRKRWKDQEKAPTPWMANELFKGRIRKVTEAPRTGLISVSVTWTDPKSAAQWANDFVGMTNSYLKAKAIAKFERHIKYLNDQAATMDIAPVRAAIYEVMEAEIKNIMLAKGSDEYALKVVDPAAIPERKSAPRVTVWVVSGMLAGLAVSIFVLLMRATWASSRRTSQAPGADF